MEPRLRELSDRFYRRLVELALQDDVERERGGGPTIRVVAVADPVYDPAAWWRSREGRKTAFLEWTKTITSLVGI